MIDDSRGCSDSSPVIAPCKWFYLVIIITCNIIIQLRNGMVFCYCRPMHEFVVGSFEQFGLVYLISLVDVGLLITEA